MSFLFFVFVFVFVFCFCFLFVCLFVCLFVVCCCCCCCCCCLFVCLLNSNLIPLNHYHVSLMNRIKSHYIKLNHINSQNIITNYHVFFHVFLCWITLWFALVQEFGRFSIDQLKKNVDFPNSYQLTVVVMGWVANQ